MVIIFFFNSCNHQELIINHLGWLLSFWGYRVEHHGRQSTFYKGSNFPNEPPLDHDCCSSTLSSGVDAILTTTKKLYSHKQYIRLGFAMKTMRLLESQRLFSPSLGIFCSHYLIFP
jgi:hypothetical protein